MVSRLLSHYWTAADAEETRQVQVEDWIEDLGEFDIPVIVEACARWRRQPGGRRPTPGDIRTYCFEERRDYGTGLTRLPKTPWDREAYARSAGWSSWLERQDAIEANKERERLAFAERDGPMRVVAERVAARALAGEQAKSEEEDKQERRIIREFGIEEASSWNAPDCP